MAIRQINAQRDNAAMNVNPKFHNENGEPKRIWELPNVRREEYYLTPELPDYVVISKIKSEGVTPPGYLLITDKTTYEGRVMEVFSEDTRIMSDVWEIGTYAWVYSPETIGQKLNEYSDKVQDSPYLLVTVGISGNYLQTYDAVVDCDPEIIATWKAYVAEKERVLAAQQRAEAERAHRAAPQVGKVVTILKRGPHKGKRGKVFWAGDKGYGPSVGVALTTAKKMIQGKKNSYESYAEVIFLGEHQVEVVGAESEAHMVAAAWVWEKNYNDARLDYLYKVVDNSVELSNIVGNRKILWADRFAALNANCDTAEGL